MSDENTYHKAIKYIIVTAVGALITVLVGQAYSYFFNLGEEDNKQQLTVHQKELVRLLTEISSKLDRPTGKSTAKLYSALPDEATPDNSKPEQKAETDKITIAYDKPWPYRRAFLFGAMLYKTQISLTGFEAANISPDEIDYVIWNYGSEPVRKAPGEVLYMAKINKDFTVQATIYFKDTTRPGIDPSKPLVKTRQIKIN